MVKRNEMYNEMYKYSGDLPKLQNQFGILIMKMNIVTNDLWTEPCWIGQWKEGVFRRVKYVFTAGNRTQGHAVSVSFFSEVKQLQLGLAYIAPVCGTPLRHLKLK